VIELACGDHGNDKIEKMAKEIENGKCLIWTGLSDLQAIDNAYSGIENNFRVITNYDVRLKTFGNLVFQNSKCT